MVGGRPDVMRGVAKGYLRVREMGFVGVPCREGAIARNGKYVGVQVKGTWAQQCRMVVVEVLITCTIRAICRRICITHRSMP